MPNSNDIESIAARWVAREHANPHDEHMQQARNEWLSADPKHLGAYARARAVFAHFDRASALGCEFDPELFLPKHAVHSLFARRRHLLSIGLTTAAAIPALSFGLIQWAKKSKTYGTGRGEILRVPLPDGSVATLNSLTQIRVHYQTHQRTIQLLKGEALFDVAKNHQRPFVVRSDDSTVTAVGTSFSVQRQNAQDLQVTVREGIVDFSPTTVAGKRLFANEKALFRTNQDLQVQTIPPAQVERMLAWREGMLSFEGDTLAQAVQEFSRYSDVRIVVNDPTLLKSQVVGRYSATDPRGFARSVASSMGLTIEQSNDAVYLSRAQHQPNASHRN